MNELITSVTFLCHSATEQPSLLHHIGLLSLLVVVVHGVNLTRL